MITNLRICKFILTCVLFSLLVGCASTGSPSGGPRDKTPPGLVVEKSDKNFSTNFTPEKLELVFDEWIELKNQQREILISPPFFKNPKITSRGKKITIEFPEEEPLREDATYTLNFGKSIVDFTEGNIAEGFRFVFATGDKIDSLMLSGSIEDAIDKTPVKDILVLLYDMLDDSVVVYEKPFYYARTDDEGKFKFENLKNDTFKLLVLEDLNFNYLLDPELERLAFPDSLLVLNDSSSYNPQLRLFKPEQSLRVLNSSSQTPGLITTVFNKEAEDIAYSYLYPSDFDPLLEPSKDTLMFWFTEARDSVGLIFENDTLDFTIKPFDSLFYSKVLAYEKSNASKTILAPFDSLQISFSSPLAKIDTAFIRLTNQPKKPKKSKSSNDSTQIDKTDLMLDSLMVDSLMVDSLVLDSLMLDSLMVDSLSVDSLMIDSSEITIDTLIDVEVDTLSSKDTLEIAIDSVAQTIDSMELSDDLSVLDSIELDSFPAIVDSLALDSLNVVSDTALIVYEFANSISLRTLNINSNWKEKYSYRIELLPGALTDIYGRQNDTLVLDFKTAGLDEFGNIAINLSGLDSAQHYVVLLKQNDEVIKKSLVRDSMVRRIEHKRLRVNTYSIELIKDDDSNGKWTTGDYWLNRQPEELKTFELEKLRENWDLEAEIYWNESEKTAIDTSGISQDSTLLQPPLEDLNIKNEDPKGRPPIDNGDKIKKEKGKND